MKEFLEQSRIETENALKELREQWQSPNFIVFCKRSCGSVSLAYGVWGTNNVGVDIFSCHDDDDSVSSSTGGSTSSFSAAIKEGSFSNLSATLCLHSKYE